MENFAFTPCPPNHKGIYPLTYEQDHNIESITESKQAIYELIKQFRNVTELDCSLTCTGMLSPVETWLYNQLCDILQKERTQLVNMARVHAIP